MMQPVFAALVAFVAVATGAPAQSPRPSSPMCVIDMGSNSFKRIVGSFDGARYEQRPVERRTLGVGDDVARNGRITDAKLAEIDAALAAFTAACARDGAAPVTAIGTAAFREAPNGRRAVEIAATHGIAMEVATEHRESELAYLVGALGRDDHAVIDNGSRSVELVAKEGGALRYLVFNQGYRLAYETFFASATSPDVAIATFRDRLQRDSAASAGFMRGRTTLVGVEFGEMADVLFGPAPIDGRIFTLAEMQQKLAEIAGMSPAAFQELKKTRDIDRALPRLVVDAALTEAFGYTQIRLTDRELGSGLIIEAGNRAR